MKISELAAASGTPADTIRYYERQGLLPAPARTAGNYRQYGDAHLARLQFIRHCRHLDMSLDEVRALLRVQGDPGADCQAVNCVLDAHIEHVSQRVRELQALKRELKALRARCASARQARDCAILDSLAKPYEPTPVAPGLRSGRLPPQGGAPSGRGNPGHGRPGAACSAAIRSLALDGPADK